MLSLYAQQIIWLSLANQQSEATKSVLGDPLAITYHDPLHSLDEDRFLTFGHSSLGRLIVVSHTDRNDTIRPISAREMTRKGKSDYEQV